MTRSPRLSDDNIQAILSSILQTAVDAIIVIDDCGTIQSVNPAAERMFGFQSTEMIGCNVNLLMPAPFHEEHDGYLRHHLETSEQRIIGIGREVFGKRKDGTVFPLHLAVSEVNAGPRKLFTGILRDISDQKAIQYELQQLNTKLREVVKQQTSELQQAQTELAEIEKLATLGRISGGIAHEIRNPLNAIKTSAYFLLNARSPSNEKTREHLLRINRQVATMENVVMALSDLARLPEPNRTSCNLVAMLETVVRGTLHPDNVVIQFDFPAGFPNACVDEQQIPIVFKNLVRNAVDAMSSGGTLTLSGNRQDQNVVIGVQDTGMGIAPDVLARIEQPFYSTKACGMGLGLALTKWIVEKNHGKLHVESTLNSGTTFWVYLPVS